MTNLNTTQTFEPRSKILQKSMGLLTAFLSCITVCTAANNIITVSQDDSGDFNGNDEKPILQAIEKAEKGTTVFIKPGTYLIHSSINPKDGITISGTPKSTLKIPSPVLTIEEAIQGDNFFIISNAAEYTAGTKIQVFYPIDENGISPKEGRNAPKLTISKVEENKIFLSEELPQTYPVGSRIGAFNHIISISDSARDITIENLVLHGGAEKSIPMYGHNFRCAIAGNGGFSYEKGPTVSPKTNIQIKNCEIKNCYGRAVSFYSAVKILVQGCNIKNIADEGVNLDHYTYYCTVSDNNIVDTVTGVMINDGSYNLIKNNNIIGCQYGILISHWKACLVKDLNTENIIENNTIYNASKVDIFVAKDCLKNKILNNTVEGRISVAEPNNDVTK